MRRPVAAVRVTLGIACHSNLWQNRIGRVNQNLPKRAKMTSRNLLLDPISGPCIAADPSEAACHRCRAPVALHQPDESRPDRLLGTCTSCPAWYLIDLGAGIMHLLPDGDELGDG